MTPVEWLQAYQTLLWWLAASSVILFLGTLALVPYLVVRIPRDYFRRDSRERPQPAPRHPLLRVALLVIKNVVGVVLLVAGIAMLVLPGQGIVTIVVALTLLDFPGKFRLERWLVTREPVFRAINWLRQRRGHPPLAL